MLVRFRMTKLGILALMLLLVLAACAPAATPAATQPPPTNPPPAAPTSAPPAVAATEAPAANPTAEAPMAKPVTLAVATNDKEGNFLVDGDGMTLYLFTKDTQGTSSCYDKCATAWPPVLVAGQPTVGEGIDAALLGTTQRKDGTSQLTYNGWPLYYYFEDQAPGDVTGQAVNEVWWVVAPDGNAVEKEQAPTSTY